MTRPLRLAHYDDAGYPVWDTDVLTAEELAADWGWIPLRREEVPIDPALVEQVARLQDGAA